MNFACSMSSQGGDPVGLLQVSRVGKPHSASAGSQKYRSQRATGADERIGVASFTIKPALIFPPFIVMTVVNRVLQFHSMSTLVLLSAVMAVVVLYETLLGPPRGAWLWGMSARDLTRSVCTFSTGAIALPLD